MIFYLRSVIFPCSACSSHITSLLPFLRLLSSLFLLPSDKKHLIGEWFVFKALNFTQSSYKINFDLQETADCKDSHCPHLVANVAMKNGVLVKSNQGPSVISKAKGKTKKKKQEQHCIVHFLTEGVDTKHLRRAMAINGKLATAWYMYSSLVRALACFLLLRDTNTAH